MNFRISTARMGGLPLLYAMMFAMSTGNLAMMSLFPAIARESGIPDVAMVAVQSVSAALGMLAMPFWAAHSDRVGRKPVILVGIVGFTVASAFTAAAIFVAVNGLVPIVAGILALVVSRAVYGGIGLAAAPAIQAQVADQTTAAERTGVLASMHSAHGLGSVVGPGLAPLLILPWVGLAGPLVIFTAIGLVILVVALRKLPDRTPPAPPSAGREPPAGKWATLRRGSVLPFVAYLAVLSGCHAANLQMLGFVVIDRLGLPPIEAQPLAGIALMFGAATAVGVQLGVMRRIRARPDKLMIAGTLLMVVGSLVMAFSHGYALMVAAYMTSCAGGAIGMPAAASGASLANGRTVQGSVAGLVSSAMSSGLLIAPVAAMVLYRHSPATAFLAIGATLTAALLALLPSATRALRAVHTSRI